MEPRTRTPASPGHARTGVRAPRNRRVRRADSKTGAAMMQRWARHWLRTCREMPLRARRLLERFDRNPEKRIHDFRRVMKAWRSLLKLAPAALADEAKAVRAEIKQLRQSFGAARDAVVVAKTLDEVLPESLNGTQPPAAAA